MHRLVTGLKSTATKHGQIIWLLKRAEILNTETRTRGLLRQKGLAKYSRFVQYYCLPERPQGVSKWGV
jgi:hypothetical protein|tara:strand:+ start:8633 stop:8836 length:204 start_codon:yes stop_codon:yes gene_type:complete